MSWSTRRALILIVGLALVGTWSLDLSVAAQRKDIILQPVVPAQPPGSVPLPNTPPPAVTGDLYSSLELPTTKDEQDALKLQIRAVQEHVETGQWTQAIKELQRLLERPGSFAPVTHVRPDGTKQTVKANVRVVANRLIGTLPKEGLAFYKQEFEPKAAAELKAAKATGNPEILADIMRLYLHTDAGAEATELLGTYLLDRGNYTQAALCFERLLLRQPVDELDSKTLLKAAIAFKREGNKKLEEKVWKQLSANGHVGFGDKRIETAKLKKWVEDLESFAIEFALSSWPMVFGNLARSGQGRGGTAYLEHDWSVPTWRMQPTRDTIRNTVANLNNLHEAVLPASFPIATTASYEENGATKKVPMILFRSNHGIHAHAAADVAGYKRGEVIWESFPFDWGMDGMVNPELGAAGAAADLQAWITQYTSMRMSHLILENSVVGSLSTDNKRVYALEDFVVTPYVTATNANPSFRSAEVKRAHTANKMRAFELDSGKFRWEVGGNSKDPKQQGNNLTDHVFLGPPMPMGGKLYVMAEKKEELLLISLDPESGNVLGEPLKLAFTKEAVVRNVHRRANACYLAYADGIMVCPTNAGGILGVDLMTRDLIWMYEYRERSSGKPTTPGGGPGLPPGIRRQPFPGGQPVMPTEATPPSTWKISPPVIQNGKVVVAPPDGTSVHCFNLRDGSPRWRQPRSSEDLYLAGVYKGQVLIVGKKTVRALKLDDGAVLWSLETGLPSGHGIASDDVYYLPLRKGKVSEAPEICAIDLKTGRIRGHTIAKAGKPGAVNAKAPEVPGNLIFFEGQVVSQSALDVTVYPQLSLKIESLDLLVKKNPDNPAVLTERGKLRLYNGELGGAIVDLRKALKNKPPADIETVARSLLYESFTEHFQRDFSAAEKYLDEYLAMCKVVQPGMTGSVLAEAQALEKVRMRNYLSLLGNGREEQRKFTDAYRAYVSLLKLDEIDNEEMLTVIDQPNVRANPFVWARGRIESMVAKATPKEREPLEKLILDELATVREKGTLEELRAFVKLFGSRLRGGREAHVELVKRLMAKSDTSSLIEAERHLGILRAERSDPVMNAQAVEMLAKLMIQREMMEDAAFYYKILDEEHSKTVVRDGKTGSDIYRELPTDRRLMLHLHVPEPTIDALEIDVQRKPVGSSSFPSGEHQLFLEGESLPFFRRYKLLIRPISSYAEFQAVDRVTNKLYWSFRMPTNSWQSIGYQWGSNPPMDPKHPFFNVGHLVVIKAGYLVYGLDMVNKKVLWSKDLSKPQRTSYKTHQVRPDGTVVVTYQDGWRQEFGSDRLLSAKVVCVQTRDSLEALDPVTGKKLWSRSDLGELCHLYNDSHHVFAIEINEGSPGRTRVFRAEDGVEVRVRDFSALYARKLKMAGSKLILADEDSAGRKVIRQYDVVKCEDDWKHLFSVNAKLLQSESENYVGLVDLTNGNVSLVDVRDGSLAIKTKVDDPAHVKDMTTIYLLEDRKSVYLACRGNDNPLAANNLTSHLMPNSGRRAIPVNGHVYCFDRESGQRRWFYRPTLEDPTGTSTEWKPVPSMMVIEQFGELPAVIFTSRYYVRQQFNTVYQVDTRVINKMTGKLEYGPEIQRNSSNQYHTLRVDAGANRVDLISYNETITLLLNGAKDEDAGSSGGPQSSNGPYEGSDSSTSVPFNGPAVIRGGGAPRLINRRVAQPLPPQIVPIRRKR